MNNTTVTKMLIVLDRFPTFLYINKYMKMLIELVSYFTMMGKPI